MPRQTKPIRVLMYSHDTFGLGHLTRTLRVARTLLRAYPELSILVLSGSPVAHWFRFPGRCDHVKLPSVVKMGPEHYAARELNVTFKQIRRMRRAVLEETAILYRPQLVMVDNVPLGMKGELVPMLERLQKLGSRPKVVLNMRDILDAPEVIRERWEADNVGEILRRFYDAIFVFGDSTVFDAAEAYELPEDRTHSLGYLRAWSRRESGPSHRPRVVVTVGGGEDGAGLVNAALGAFAEFGPDRPFDVTIVTGPLMCAADRRMFAFRSAGVPGIEIVGFSRTMLRRMASAHLVIAMGGYNTVCEILSAGCPAVLVPRTFPRVEQKMRAQALAKVRRAVHLPLDEATPERLAAAIGESLEMEGRSSGRRIDLEGGARMIDRLEELLPWLVESRRQGDSARAAFAAGTLGRMRAGVEELS